MNVQKRSRVVQLLEGMGRRQFEGTGVETAKRKKKTYLGIV